MAEKVFKKFLKIIAYAIFAIIMISIMLLTQMCISSSWNIFISSFSSGNGNVALTILPIIHEMVVFTIFMFGSISIIDFFKNLYTRLKPPPPPPYNKCKTR